MRPSARGHLLSAAALIFLPTAVSAAGTIRYVAPAGTGDGSS